MADILYIVVPCYNEEAVLPETSRRLKEKLEGLMAAGKIAALQRARHEEWINERYHNAPFYLLEGDAHG